MATKTLAFWEKRSYEEKIAILVATGILAVLLIWLIFFSPWQPFKSSTKTVTTATTTTTQVATPAPAASAPAVAASSAPSGTITLGVTKGESVVGATPTNACITPSQLEESVKKAVTDACPPKVSQSAAKSSVKREKRKEVAKAPASALPATAAVTSKVEVTNEVVETLTVRQEVRCERGGVTVQGVIKDGRAECPPLEITAPSRVQLPTRVEAPITVAPAGPSPVQSAKKPAISECKDCGPEVKLDRKVARTDGRCVVAFKDPGGVVRYARFDAKRGSSMLVAAKVDDVKAEWNRSYTPTYVGYINGNEKKTVELAQPFSCEAVYRAISNPVVLAWTGPRLGLTPDCRPVGRANEL